MYCVIMAGGRGTRFWPQSRASRPKQLLPITGTETMIQETVARVAGIVAEDNIFIVTASEHADLLANQVPFLPPDNILVEPCGRNTAPCICLAALTIHNKSPDDVMVVLPADHYIGDRNAFHSCLAACAEAARHTGTLVTIGIKPDRPETGYGYMQYGQHACSFIEQDFFRVDHFHEKPDRNKAAMFLQKGTVLWNSGMFVWKTSAILQAIENCLPDMYRSLSAALSGPQTAASKLVDAYNSIIPVSIDYGVMEKTDNVIVAPGDFGWNDIGSWSALHDISPRDTDGNTLRGNALCVGSHNTFVSSPSRLAAVVGVQDLVIIDTEDVLLVCSKDAAQDVKKVTDILKKEGKNHYL